MNKEDIVKYMADNSDKALTQKEASLAVDLFRDAIKSGLTAGDDINLVDFFTLKPNGHPARKGRNPQTGEEIQIPASVNLKFKPAKKLAATVSELNPEDYMKKK